jgi:4'-phosphopantetheinyl transferase
MQEQGFFNAWTRKEAYLKGLGRGLSMKLDQFDVSLAPGEPAKLFASREPGHAAERWRLCLLDVPAGYTAALAVAGADWRLRSFSYGSPDSVEADRPA